MNLTLWIEYLPMILLPIGGMSVLVLYYTLTRQRKTLERLELRSEHANQLLVSLQESRQNDQKFSLELKSELWRELREYRQGFDQQQLQNFTLLQTSLQQSLETINQRMDRLTELTQQRLQSIGGYVEQRLSDGFSKTTETFTQVIERLAMIDAAQKQISELSGHVVDLQQILSDKSARGVFGEMQLNALIQNALPTDCFKLQYTFSQGKRADCVLFLPPPTGTIAIDAKFPLESFRQSVNMTISESERVHAATQFRQDIRRHIQDVASKYIIPGETTEGAILFIPAETIFAEIHAHHSIVVEEAHRARVWLTSPSTLMAILTTARAVLKDAKTREQVHVIKRHLTALGTDFTRFQARMNQLAKHIEQAHQDIQTAQISAKKITHHFRRIENVELKSEETLRLEEQK